MVGRIGALVLAVTAAMMLCVPPSSSAQLPAFDAGAAEFINTVGKAHISGQAFVRQTNGRLLRAIGTDVFLIPKTAYADARMSALYGSGKKLQWGTHLPPEDPLYKKYVRKTVATSGGSFSFDHVADGDYFVVAMIFQPGEFVSFQFPIMERVSVRHGESVRVVMRGY